MGGGGGGGGGGGWVITTADCKWLNVLLTPFMGRYFLLFVRGAAAAAAGGSYWFGQFNLGTSTKLRNVCQEISFRYAKCIGKNGVYLLQSMPRIWRRGGGIHWFWYLIDLILVWPIHSWYIYQITKCMPRNKFSFRKNVLGRMEFIFYKVCPVFGEGVGVYVDFDIW